MRKKCIPGFILNNFSDIHSIPKNMGPNITFDAIEKILIRHSSDLLYLWGVILDVFSKCVYVGNFS
jgi:hypothetical protein